MSIETAIFPKTVLLCKCDLMKIKSMDVTNKYNIELFTQNGAACVHGKSKQQRPAIPPKYTTVVGWELSLCCRAAFGSLFLTRIAFQDIFIK